MVIHVSMVDEFTDFVTQHESRLRESLIAACGGEIGRDAAAEALIYGWEHWDRVSAKPNPLGYVYGVGRNKARRTSLRRNAVFFDVQSHRLPHVEPGLLAAIARLPEKQRIAVTLVHGYEWTLSEVAEVLGTKKPTVQKHAERGLARLRKNLGVES